MGILTGILHRTRAVLHNNVLDGPGGEGFLATLQRLKFGAFDIHFHEFDGFTAEMLLPDMIDRNATNLFFLCCRPVDEIIGVVQAMARRVEASVEGDCAAFVGNRAVKRFCR